MGRKIKTGEREGGREKERTTVGLFHLPEITLGLQFFVCLFMQLPYLIMPLL